MQESIIRTKATNFAIEILKLVKELRARHESSIIGNQIGRSGTSIGANIHEAQFAQSRSDFITKLQIALKETAETRYWLELLLKTSTISTEEHVRLESLCKDIQYMLVASLNTVKKREG